MHFRTYDHYPTWENDPMYLNNVCFICLDDKLIDNIQPLKWYSYRLALCDCNMHIHRTCLHNWHLYKNECPLCRKQSSLLTVKSIATDYVHLFVFLTIKLAYIMYFAYIIIAISHCFNLIIHPMYRS